MFNSAAGSSINVSAHITNNTLAEPTIVPPASFQRAISVSVGNSGGASVSACVEVANNNISGTWQAGNFVRITNLNNALVMNVQGLTPATGATAAQVNAFIQGTNTFGLGSTGADVNSTLGPGINGGTCSPLLAADGEAPAGTPVSTLQPGDAAAMLRMARARWIASDPSLAPRLGRIALSIADLPGAMLGRAEGASITIDPTAAGWGWFVDPTPTDDSKFAGAAPPRGAAGRIDLLTALVHEIGHVLGRPDLDAADHAADVMAATLARGVRRMPPAAAAHALDEAIAPASTTVTTAPFTLPANRSVTITLDVTVPKPFFTGVPSVSMQASYVADGVSPAILSDDPATGPVPDPTVTPISCPAITVLPATLPHATGGTLYSQLLTQTGGPGLVTFAKVLGSLPSGVSLQTSGLLTGTPTQIGSFSFRVAAVSDNGCSSGERDYTLQVDCPAIAIQPGILHTGLRGLPYVPVVFSATGATAPVVFSSSSTLPSGMTFVGGVLGGTPTALAALPFNVTATDANACTATAGYTIAINPPRFFAVAKDQGSTPEVRLFDALGVQAPGPLGGDFLAYDPAFTGGVRVAVHDLTSDGVPDIVTGPGPSGGPHMRVIDGGGGSLLANFFAFPDPPAGIYVAAGDVNDDGRPDVIVSRGSGPPFVRVFDGYSGAILRDFLAYTPSFTGGVRVAAGDINGDGFADIITGAGPGGGPHVEVFSGFDGSVLRSFFAYTPGFTGGVYVAAGDVDGDGYADIITGAGPGGGPHVEVFSGRTGALIRSFFAYAPAFTGGVRVAAGDLNGDGRAEIITGAGPGGGPHVRVFDGATGAELTGLFAFDPGFTGGVNVGAASPRNFLFIDTPTPASAPAQPFPLSGWAFQEAPPAGAGIQAIHVWAYPDGGGLPLFAGAATLGDPRPDVAAIYGGQFTNSGFHLTVTGLPAGGYTLVVFVNGSLTATFNDRRLVHVTVH
ncbi:MAG: hypothetical protein DMF86_12800 [Acidobacteria bacterium]|nr:MAG: hypothetical protein DMF86_12800 [Acidobacteriota bacterium]